MIELGESLSETRVTMRFGHVKLKSQKGYGGISNDCIRIISQVSSEQLSWLM